MTRIKIVSNPYNRSLSYFIYKPQTESWEDIKQDNINPYVWGGSSPETSFDCSGLEMITERDQEMRCLYIARSGFSSYKYM